MDLGVRVAGYYTQKLSGRRLQRCYDLAPTRVQRYLDAEISHVQSRLLSTDVVLELGCGYGRVAMRLAQTARRVIGIDTSQENLDLARHMMDPGSCCEYLLMDALNLRFADEEFDAVVCVQNGISAFGVDQEALVREALRVLHTGGLAMFSTYSDRFWPERLAWFELQAKEGLIGPIDREASGGGAIVCTDGFRAGRLTPDELQSLCSRLGAECQISEVDGSSVFCEIRKSGPAA